MSPRPKSLPKVQDAASPNTSGGHNVFIKNEFRSDPLPEVEKLARIRDQAPEVYERYLEEIRMNGEANRDFQTRSLALDEKVVPSLVLNDRIGMGLSFLFSAGALGLAFYCLKTGLPYWWIPLILTGLAPVLSAIRGRRE